MSGELTQTLTGARQLVSSSELAKALAATDFSGCAATVVGYGFMGKQFVKALQALGVGQIRVVSQSEQPLQELQGVPGVTTKPGGYQRLDTSPEPGELGIVTTPTAQLVDAAQHLADCGFRRLLIEKPVSLRSVEISHLSESLDRRGLDAVCAYNRLAYPSFLEARALAEKDGGITSCLYTFTELITADWTSRHAADELARWGIANSLHPIGMAHGLIGLPETWSGRRSDELPWHLSGSVFVGSGVSDLEIPFAYQADWGSKGRWSVEVSTQEAVYRLCPLERLFTKTSALDDWRELPLSTFDPLLKTGIAEEVAAMLSGEIRPLVPLMDLKQTSRLTAYGEELFGYGAS